LDFVIGLLLAGAVSPASQKHRTQSRGELHVRTSAEKRWNLDGHDFKMAAFAHKVFSLPWDKRARFQMRTMLAATTPAPSVTKLPTPAPLRLFLGAENLLTAELKSRRVPTPSPTPLPADDGGDDDDVATPPPTPSKSFHGGLFDFVGGGSRRRREQRHPKARQRKERSHHRRPSHHRPTPPPTPVRVDSLFDFAKPQNLPTPSPTPEPEDDDDTEVPVTTTRKPTPAPPTPPPTPLPASDIRVKNADGKTWRYGHVLKMRRFAHGFLAHVMYEDGGEAMLRQPPPRRERVVQLLPAGESWDDVGHHVVNSWKQMGHLQAKRVTVPYSGMAVYVKGASPEALNNGGWLPAVVTHVHYLADDQVWQLGIAYPTTGAKSGRVVYPSAIVSAVKPAPGAGFPTGAGGARSRGLPDKPSLFDDDDAGGTLAPTAASDSDLRDYKQLMSWKVKEPPTPMPTRAPTPLPAHDDDDARTPTLAPVPTPPPTPANRATITIPKGALSGMKFADLPGGCVVVSGTVPAARKYARFVGWRVVGVNRAQVHKRGRLHQMLTAWIGSDRHMLLQRVEEGGGAIGSYARAACSSAMHHKFGEHATFKCMDDQCIHVPAAMGGVSQHACEALCGTPQLINARDEEERHPKKKNPVFAMLRGHRQSRHQV
jgi:hypothetical protein